MPLLEVDKLSVRFATPDGAVQAVDGLSFALDAGQTLGIVGESGSGKSQTALAILGLLARNAKVSGAVRFEGQDLLKLPGRKLARLRGNRIAMVFQDPMTSLNPYLRVERQIAEVLQRHRGLSQSAARSECLRLLDAVQIPDAAQRLRSYPHELSGGQRQRVMIAIALACQPALLLADEPTTALDVTVQAQILGLFQQLRQDFGVAIVLISHDFGVVAEVCERTLVMYAGRAAELGPTQTLLEQPAHPYSRALVGARPDLSSPVDRPLMTLPGQPPDLSALPPGCAFAPRCQWVEAGTCTSAVPMLRTLGTGRSAACARVEAIARN
ncbi:ABC transporter ATP-binding protein [Panacagrimonas sp.]|uniref:ABC transporter ATP-binding protein n=1 Tax=Panacagrimonas sp. TaxID=2480088 RepID=UPI003B52EAC8